MVKNSKNLNFLQYKKIAFIASAILVLFSVCLIFIKGLNMGIDFTGGIVLEIKTEHKVGANYVRNLLKNGGVSAFSLQYINSGSNENTANQPSLREETSGGTGDEILIKIAGDGIQSYFRGVTSTSSEPTYNKQERSKPDDRGKNDGDSEKSENGNKISGLHMVKAIKDLFAKEYEIFGEVEYKKVEFVGPQIGKELITNGLLALGFALLGILLYIWSRFEWQYGVCAVVALFHDVILTFGLYSLLGMEFNLGSVAAFLTVIGYSINDTVVIFDRVRENIFKHKLMEVHEVINKSINNNLRRTILTSFTTSLALLAMVFVGGNALYGFSVAILAGVIVGTYSSIAIASPLLLNFNLKKGIDKEKEEEEFNKKSYETFHR